MKSLKTAPRRSRFKIEGEIRLKPVGIIRTSYKNSSGMPIQGRFADARETGRIEIFPPYRRGLKDVGEFSHAVLIYYFDRMKEERIVARPFLEDKPHGIFAVRSPYRPNHIGFSVVKLKTVGPSSVTFSEVDILDGTPLLDIKPYVSHFDSRKNVKNGWIGKHFKRGAVPRRVKLP